jgi:hypothetical protein
VYLLGFTTIVGLASGVMLAFIWSLRTALSADTELGRRRLVTRRRALLGLLYLLSGLTAGAILTGASLLVSLVAVLLVTKWLFVGDPPAVVATLSFGLLILTGLVVAARFASWWQRRIWSRLPA